MDDNTTDNAFVDENAIVHDPIAQIGEHNPADVVAAAREENAKPAPVEDVEILRLKVEEVEHILTAHMEAFAHLMNTLSEHDGFIGDIRDYIGRLRAHFDGKV